jgi:hypothetical protein
MSTEIASEPSTPTRFEKKTNIPLSCRCGTFSVPRCSLQGEKMEAHMGFGRGALLWLLGIPLPIIILLALFWH